MENKGKSKEKDKEREPYGQNCFINRELSWLEFNSRVLMESRDKARPLFERLKFISIASSNLDEFYMIRVASLKDMVNANYKKKDLAGMTASEQLEKISGKAHELVQRQYGIYNKILLPLLKEGEEGKVRINLLQKHEEMNTEQEKFADQYFQENIYPVLTPMAVDSSRPFPLIRNKSLNIGALIYDKKTKGDFDFATVQVPSGLERIVELPSDKEGERSFLFLEEIIERNLPKLFLNYKILCAHPYRIMRNADLTIEEDEAADLLLEIQKKIKKRQWGQAIRLEVEEGMDQRLLKILRKELKLKDEDIFKLNGPLDLTFLMRLYGMKEFEVYRKKAYKPKMPPELMGDGDIFETIRKKDILLHHPYISFDPVVNFVGQAALDPNVLAIKQTLYRVSSNSPIISSLARAAENGKQVTVLVELKARFDEENNILWAKKLEKAGCHVIYGLVGLKTHSKITLVVRREEDGIRRYVHLGTGNYNDSTAKMYTDTGIFTCSTPIGEDATAVFNMLSGYSEPLQWNRLVLAPLWLRGRFLALIKREAEHAKQGKAAYICAKMNSLCDAEIILALYDASKAGVKIDLIVRGICCLRPGAPYSENIRVKSIVGDFLEHARIFYFENGGYPELFMGSADWMPRNLDKRVEILFPIEDDNIKEQVIDILNIQMKDNLKSHWMQQDGNYQREKNPKEPFSAQEHFCKYARKMKKEERLLEEKEAQEKRVFEPLTAEDIEG